MRSLFPLLGRLLVALFLLVPVSANALEVDSGEVTLPATMDAAPGTWVTVNFGTTFSSPPVVIATPGAHLLIEQGGIKFQIHLLIELVDHFGFKHGVAPFYYSLANESDTIICYLYIFKK